MNEFKVRKGLIVQGSGSNIFDVQGSQGQLFSITDSLSGSLFSVNDISGIPIMEVFSDNTIKLGTFNQEAIIVSGSRTGMGTPLPQAKLHISGASNSGLFEIDSPAQNNIIYVSGSGNIGIGTGTPFQKLYVDGDIGLKGANVLNLAGDQGSSRTAGFQFSGATYDKIFVYTNNATIGSFSRDNGWGIGGSFTPTSRLQVRGSGATSATTALRVENSNASASLVVLDNGNVGIGTSSPTYTLDISTTNATSPFRLLDTTASGYKQFNVTYTSSFTTQLNFGSLGRVEYDGNGGVLTVANTSTQAGSSRIRFVMGSTEAMRIADTRNIAIGTTTTTGGRLTIQGSGSTSATTALRVENSAATARLTILDDGTSAFNTSHLYISSSGNVGIGTTTPSQQLHIFGGSIIVNKTTANDDKIFIGSSITDAVNNERLLITPFKIRLNSNTSFFEISGDNLDNGGLIKINSRNSESGSVSVRGQSGANSLTTTFSGRGVGIGTSSPSASLHISGASNSGLLEIDSPAVNNIIYVSGSGNVGIGVATPAYKLDITGSNNILKISGNDSDDAIFLDERMFITFGDSNAKTNRFRGITSGFVFQDNAYTTFGQIGPSTTYFNSNVGIGETSPSARLEIRGSGATSATTALRVENSNASASLVVLDDRQTRITSDGAALFVEGAGVSPFTQNIAEFRYAGNGNSLIISAQSGVAGLTTSTNTNLNINPNGTGATVFLAGKQVTLNNSNNNGIIALQNTGATGQTRLDFITGSSTIMSISGSGNVGIGTTNPQVDLEVASKDATSTVARIRLTNKDLSIIDEQELSEIQFFNSDADGAHISAYIKNIAAETFGRKGQLAFGVSTTNSTNAVEALRIDENANVGIGTTTPTNTLQVVGGITATSITSSLLGTASVAINAQTASFLPIGTYSITSSQAINAQTASFLPIGTYSITSSWATNALTASNITPSITNNTDNRVLTATGGGTINGESNLTFDGSVLTVTGRANISTSITSSTATVGFGLTSALNAGQTTIRGSGVDTVGALTIQNSGGTATFTVLNGGTTGVGENNPSARLHVKGSGATSATTALRVENSSADARLTILDDGTSAFNTSHLYISSSGNVGIGTTNPGAKLEIDLDGTGKYLRFNDWSGNYATYGWGITSNIDKFRLPSIVYFGDSSFYFQKSGLNGFLVSFNDLQLGSSNTANGGSKVYLYGQQSTGNVGIGTTSPSTRLHISGASNSGLFEIDSPAQNNIIYVSGSGNVGIGTGTPTNTLQVVGGVTATSFTGSLLGTASLATTALTASFLSTGTYNITSSWAQSASNAVNAQTASRVTNNLTQGTGITSFTYNGSGAATVAVAGASSLTAGYLTRWNGTSFVNSFISQSSPVGGDVITIGPTGTTVQSVIVSSSISSTGNITAPSFIGTSSWATNAVTASFLNGAFLQNGNSFGTTALLGTNDNQNLQFETNGTVKMHISSSGNVGIGTTTPSELFQIVRSGDTKIIAGINVGIQTASPDEWIHLVSDPTNGRYIKIEAEQTNASPQEQNNGAPDTAIGSSANWQKYLTEPDYWMEIYLKGNIVLIPCYLHG